VERGDFDHGLEKADEEAWKQGFWVEERDAGIEVIRA
jgi:hypothetical protein